MLSPFESADPLRFVPREREFEQHRRLDWKYVQPVKQVLAERSIGPGVFQIAICGSNDANVHVDGAFSPHALEFPFL
jgi:hypothetical protein